MKLKDFKNYEGNDASLEISLYEYGLIWRLKDSEKEEYDIVYGVGTNEKGEYNLFEKAIMNKSEYMELLKDSNIKGFNSFRGTEFNSFKGTEEINFPLDLLDALCYYGPDNIFGSEPIGFSIERI